VTAPGRRAVGRAEPLAVREVGDPTAPAVVLVHGIGMSERYFRPLAAELAADRRVLVPDLPGFGRSPRPAAAPSVEDVARTVLRMLGRREVGPAVLVGHSMGAQVVAAMMARAPARAPAGVLIGPVVDSGAPSPAGQAWRLARDGLHEPARVNAAVTVDYLRTGPRWYAAMLPRMLGFDTCAAVSRVRGGILVVRGERDRVCSRPWARRLALAAPHGQLREVRGAGHVAMATHPAVVARWIRERAA